MNLGIEYNELINNVTATWPLLVTLVVGILLLSVWLSEGGSAKVAKKMPGTKSHSDYKFFKEHGYWPGTPEAFPEDYTLRDDEEE